MKELIKCFLAVITLWFLTLTAIGLSGCTMGHVITTDPNTKITTEINYKYFLQNKIWSATLPGGTKIDFNNTNQAITDLANTIKILADKFPVAIP